METRRQIKLGKEEIKGRVQMERHEQRETMNGKERTGRQREGCKRKVRRGDRERSRCGGKGGKKRKMIKIDGKEKSGK